jgi:hypothetical protein
MVGMFFEMSRLQAKQESRPILLRLLPAEIRKKQFKFSIRAVDRPSTQLGFLFGFEVCPDLIHQVNHEHIGQQIFFVHLIIRLFKKILN